MVESLMSMIQWGVDWVLYLLVGLSVIGVALFVERVVYFRRHGGNVAGLKTELLKGLGSEDELARLEQRFAAYPAVPARLCAVALSCRDRSPEAAQEVTDSVALEERQRLERGLNFMGTVGANAPFIGLFGTVLGIVQAFHDLSTARTAGPQVVMAGISEALVATAVGLVVAIPAVVAFNYFKGRVKRILSSSDVLVKLVMSHHLDRHLAGTPSGAALNEMQAAEVAEKASELAREKLGTELEAKERIARA